MNGMTEEEMREQKVPHFDTESDLIQYIHNLVEREHDYGTCVYAMSLAAVAAFNYVAGRLGVTGFQASCADLDILRHTRHWNYGKLLNYENLLYPQYCDSENFPSWLDLLENPEIRAHLKVEAQKLLDDSNGIAAPEVVSHWRMLAEWEAIDIDTEPD